VVLLFELHRREVGQGAVACCLRNPGRSTRPGCWPRPSRPTSTPGRGSCCCTTPPELAKAEPATIRTRLYHLPARLTPTPAAVSSTWTGHGPGGTRSPPPGSEPPSYRPSPEGRPPQRRAAGRSRPAGHRAVEPGAHRGVTRRTRLERPRTNRAHTRAEPHDQATEQSRPRRSTPSAA